MKEKTYHPISFFCYFLVFTLILCSIQLPVSAENKEPEMSILSLYQSEDGFTTYWVDENGDRVYINSNQNDDGIDYVPMLPTSYDSREDNIITSVKSQGNSGACWAFSTISCMETSAIKNGLANDDIDLSEGHLVWYTYKNKTTDKQDGTYGDGYDIDDPYNKGGSWLSSIFTLARGSGAALETDYPFMNEHTSYTQDDMYASNIRMYSAEALGTDDKSTNKYIFDQDKVKQSIIDNGSVKASYYSNNGYTLNNYNKTAANGTAYYQKGNYSSNHAITIVGWDDSYSRQNFKSDCQPPSDGAWLVKNSWGNASILTDGYFWLSYEEPTIDGIVKYTAAANDIYDNIYQYDGAGYGSSLAYANIYSLKEANVFTAKKQEKLTHVGFYTVQNNLNYSVSIYTDIKSDYSSPTDGTLYTTFSGTAENEGYRTVQIPTKINLNKDDIFSVVVTLSSTNKKQVYIPIEYTDDSGCTYSSKQGQSFYSLGNNWHDSSADSNNNVCVKAMTKNDYCKNDEHSFIYDGENITCSKCDYSKPATGFTGFVNDKSTNGLMYLKSGTPTKGWLASENDNYYFGNSGIAYTEQQTIENHTYTFDENGKLIKGAWDVTDSGVSYLWANNKKVTGWQYIDCAIYYFDLSTFYRATISQIIDDKYYAFTSDGKLQLISNSIKIGNLYYSFDDNGVLLTDHINDHAYNPVTVASETIQATCTADGKEIKKCSGCEKREDHVLKATGHKAVVDSAVAPTCIKSGLTEGSHCSVCGTKIKTQSVVSALGHKFGEWTVSVPATCSSKGTEIRTCSVCGKTESRDIAISEHLHTQLINKKTATCTETGYTGDLFCNDCKTVISKGGITNKTAHTIASDSAVAPTCTKTGLTSGSHCSVCGTVINKQNIIDALGHNFGEWKVVTAATENSVGEREHFCLTCNYRESETIPMLTTVAVTTTNSPVTTTQATTSPSIKPSVTTTQTTAEPTTFTTVTAVTPTETSATASESDTASVTEISATVSPTTPTTASSTVATTAQTSLVTDSTTIINIQDYILGDVNGDGHVTASDARLALRISAALESSTDLQLIVADVDFNKRITASDARKILRFSANLEKF